MIRWLLLALTILAPTVASARALHSQHRGSAESYSDAEAAYRTRLRRAGVSVLDTKSALDSALPVVQLDLSVLPQYADYALALRIFESLRDERFLYPTTGGSAPLPRRVSWLYPDDGCYTRSAVVSKLIGDWKQTRPAKVFVFGNLEVITKNSPTGSVRWWYHVSSAVLVDDPASGKREAYVLDPAISPKVPLRLNEWFMRMNPDLSTLRAVFCDPNTYVPSQLCRGDVGNSDADAISLQQSMFLRLEESRLRELGRDPQQELGDNPPWKN